jgi:hypothetical protein
MNMHPTGILEHQVPQPERPRGPIIEELISDDEKEDTDKEKNENPRKHGRSSSKAFVEDPEDEVEGKVHLLTGCNAIFFFLSFNQYIGKGKDP